MEDRPNVTRKTSVQRNVEFQINVDVHCEIVCNWLRKIFPEFRGFANDEIELTFESSGVVNIHAYREEERKL